MTLIRLDGISRFFGANEVLVDLSFQVEEGERIGLVGPNGCGKTTLARLIAGELEPDRGSVHRKKGLTVGYLAQEADVDAGVSVLENTLTAFQDLLALHEELAGIEGRMADGDHTPKTLARYGHLRELYEKRGGYAFEHEARSALFGLGFREEDLSKPAGILSGGQRSRLSLARLLVRKPDLLLLDEPTNHLDLQATEWLEGFLSASTGAVVLISHDRYFLDRTVTRVAELERKKLVLYRGNYSAYVAEKERRVDQQQKHYEEQRAFIDRTEEFIRRNIAGQKTKQAQSRRRTLEKLERLEKPAAQGRAARFGLAGPGRTGDHALAVEGLTKAYGERTLFRDVTFALSRGDRLGIVGPNGAGKTTLLRVLAGQIRQDQGQVRYGHRVVPGYYDQEREGINLSNTVLEEVRTVRPTDQDGDLRSFLGRFLFTGDEVHQVVGTLSGGEQSRVALARLILSCPSLLLLDEPTNHLDIRSRTALEEALSDFQGTILAVSHDRFFLNRIARTILWIEEGSCRILDGDYDAFVETRRRQGGSGDPTAHPVSAHPQAVGSGPEIPKTARRAAYEHVRKADRERDRRVKRFARIEEEIVALEDQVLVLEEEMARPEVARDWERLGDLSRRRDSLRAAVDRLYEEWTTLEGLPRATST